MSPGPSAFPRAIDLFRPLLLVGLALVGLPSSAFAQCPDPFAPGKPCEALRDSLAADSSQDLCGTLIGDLSHGSRDLDQLGRITFCLKEIAPPSRMSDYLKAFRAKLPKEAAWYETVLETYKQQKEIPAALRFAQLAEWGPPPSAQLRHSLAELYELAGEILPAARSYLLSAKLNPGNEQLLEYRLESLLKSAQSELPPSRLLDSLATYREAMTPAIHGLLEALAWRFEHPPAAFHHLIARGAKEKLEPRDILRASERFLSLDYPELALQALDKSSWQNWPDGPLEAARENWIRAVYEAQNWELAAEGARKWSPGELSFRENRLLAEMEFHTDLISRASERCEALAASSNPEHEAFCLSVELRSKVAQGDTLGAADIVQNAKRSRNRRWSSAQALFWEGWVRIMVGHFAQADSLMMLASAYTDEAVAEKAIEYRYWLLMDTSTAAAPHFFAALPESPLPLAARLALFDSVPDSSPLQPEAALLKAEILIRTGALDKARKLLERVSSSLGASPLALEAQTHLGRLLEKAQKRREAVAAYESLLLKSQQGVAPELARHRLEKLR